MTSKPHQELNAAFKAWAMADENPNALWSIDRCVARELFEQLEAQAAALCRIALVCPKPLLNGNANYLEDAQSAQIHRLCEASSQESERQ